MLPVNLKHSPKLYSCERGFLSVVALAASTLVFNGFCANATETSKAMLVLDASGSMWSQVDGKPKIDIARSTIRDLLKDWNPSVELGLSAYGHRRKGDCQDIQTLNKVGSVKAGDILNSINALSPKGKTPLSAAVQQAAEELKFTEDKATVILVSDGHETCGADPCAIGKALSDLGVDFRVHVIGFDIKENKDKGLRCLAKNTGGLYFSAGNASQLNNALKTAVKKVVAEPKPKKQQEAKRPYHRFEAVLATGGDPVKHGMLWEIYKKSESSDAKPKTIKRTRSGNVIFTLEPERHVAVATYGNAVVRKEFDVEDTDKDTRHTIVLGAGTILASAALDEESAENSDGMQWQVFETTKDIEGRRKKVSTAYNATPVFHLKAVKYLIIAKRGKTSISKEVDVAAGDQKKYSFSLKGGSYRFKALFAPGGETVTEDMRWYVYSRDKSLDGNRKEINRSYDAEAQFTLPEGLYHVVAQRGLAKASKELTVRAGDQVETEFNLNAGLLTAAVALTANNEPEKKDIRWDIYTADKDSDGKRRHIGESYHAKTTFALNEGRYLVKAKSGDAVTQAEVNIAAGQKLERTFDLKAGRVRLVALAANKKPITRNLRWDVFAAADGSNAKATRVGCSYRASPTFTLNAGSYVVVVKTGGLSNEHTLEVTPGMTQKIDLSIQ